MRYNQSELRLNEIFLGNTNKVGSFPPDYLKSLKTIRMGEIALDISGNRLSRDYCRPIFINKSEEMVYDKIMTERHRNSSHLLH